MAELRRIAALEAGDEIREEGSLDRPLREIPQKLVQGREVFVGHAVVVKHHAGVVLAHLVAQAEEVENFLRCEALAVLTGMEVEANVEFRDGGGRRFRGHFAFAVQTFRPDMLIVDKEPLGVKNELLPALRHVRDSGMRTRLVCGFRDILDEREKIEEEWARKGVLKALGEFYDTLLVYGEKQHFDFEREYNLPEHLGRKVIHTGYVQPKENLEKEFFALDFPRDRPVVTFTLGGGGDGWEYIDTFLTMLEERLAGDDVNFVLLTGPFANQPIVERAKRLESVRTNVRVLNFTNNSLGLFERSRLVISMGGYNSVCELLHLRKYPLILPRVTPREEQLIRARVFKARGLCDYIHPRDLSPLSLAAKVRELVDFDRSAVPAFETNGIENVSQFIEETLGCRPKSGSFLKVIHA